jgi:pyruvate, water dikinase
LQTQPKGFALQVKGTVMKGELVYTLDFSQITLKSLPLVGGKNASLGELFNALKSKGIGVLDGFATTADAYRTLLAERDLESVLSG